MTHSQLEHLNLIDAHLERLLANARKRTPGEWTIKTQQRELGQSGEFETEAWIAPDDASKCVTNGWNLEDEDEDNFAFIASCAGNAEAGWRVTRKVINWIFLTKDTLANTYEIDAILSAFPLELIQKP